MKWDKTDEIDISLTEDNDKFKAHKSSVTTPWGMYNSARRVLWQWTTLM